MSLKTVLFIISFLFSSLALAAENISVISSGALKIHTFHGISNSHLIETKNELHLIDAQMTFKHARQLKKYIDSVGKPLVQVILSHNHPDHWFGAEIFSSQTPIATTANITKDLKNGGYRYIKNLKKKLKDNMPDQVIKPDVELNLGQHNWDGLKVIVEEYAEQESHHSLVLKLPEHGIMIGQDLFYNEMFLVASDRNRNKHWVEILQNFSANEAKHYKTILVGHGKNSDPAVFTQDIKYLNALEATLAKGLTQQQTQQEMIKQFPEKGGKGMLAISMRNLFNPH
ncbi:MAG: MBL fold metallo-hydrolase [Gammaproteobacteria bacterium]|jgi:hypothetical protein|nr:MBL fold metallo-hydrolase [Gammaproteobacteria bacterium]MBT3724356.1 MBL fold metallo-hydrolase [Gammaproteobacteria bacterium]MBT4077086.1 MBL fold metallo-hydrolase [Gammaproteobacteria bacterium]MBT4194041.1 MBL fold metallo-hydrolase [Gammaproteobacteria bacterium]MBT4452060.1 MBL fold metallo-hydrolase [Gammaproteobacteria bacterium]